MRKESTKSWFRTPPSILALVCLRYRLNWAAARTGAGKAATILVAYAVGLVLFTVLGTGGMGTATAAHRLGHEEQVARGVLTGLFVCGVIVGLTFGAGPRCAFSDAVLRRYPMTARERIASRHLTGLLDPAWPLLLAVAVGLVVGFALSNPWRLAVGLPVAVFYVCLIYIVVVTLLSLADRMLLSRSGGFILGSLIVSLIAVAPLAPSLRMHITDQGWMQNFDRVNRWMPPGAAAALIAGEDVRGGIVPGVALAGWFVLAGMALYSLERLPAASGFNRQGKTSWSGIIDTVGNLFGRRLGPLVAKSLRCQLRSVQCRFGLAASLPFVILLPRLLSSRSGAVGDYLMTLSLFFLIGAIPTGGVIISLLGGDGPGVRRYSLLPIPFDRALRASSAAALLTGGIAIPAAILCYVFSGRLTLDARLILMLALSSLAGLFYFNAIGIWLSVLSPFPVKTGSLLGNRAPFHTVVIQVAATQPLVMVMLYLREKASLESVRDFWWILAVAPVVCAMGYAVSLLLAGRLANSRRERMTARIAGPGSI